MSRGQILEGSQEYAVLHHLQTGAEIEPFFALRQYGILRLAAAIYYLRRAGFAIDTRLERRNGKHWAAYSLSQHRSIDKSDALMQDADRA